MRHSCSFSLPGIKGLRILGGHQVIRKPDLNRGETPEERLREGKYKRRREGGGRKAGNKEMTRQGSKGTMEGKVNSNKWEG